MKAAQCSFTFEHYRDTLRKGLALGYEFGSCQDWIEGKLTGSRVCVMRHDVDFTPERSIVLAQLEHSLGIKATYFFRCHANQYNPLGFDTVSFIRGVKRLGHEVGLHAEPIDFGEATCCSPETFLRLSKTILETVSGGPIVGVASHNDWTPSNNLDFWQEHSPQDFGFAYEAYGPSLGLWTSAVYLSDSLMWGWKRYDHGVGPSNCACLCSAWGTSPLLYVLTHPHAWYAAHFHRSDWLASVEVPGSQ